MELSIQRTTKATFYGLVRMSDLRKFVEATKNIKDTAPLVFDIYRGDQRDPSSVTIVVNDA